MLNEAIKTAVDFKSTAGADLQVGLQGVDKAPFPQGVSVLVQDSSVKVKIADIKSSVSSPLSSKVIDLQQQEPEQWFEKEPREVKRCGSWMK